MKSMTFIRQRLLHDENQFVILVINFKCKNKFPGFYLKFLGFCFIQPDFICNIWDRILGLILSFSFTKSSQFIS